MPLSPLPLAVVRGFREEAEKLGASRAMLAVAQSRSGRRPISIAKLLERDAAGTLLKKSSVNHQPVDRPQLGGPPAGARPSPLHARGAGPIEDRLDVPRHEDPQSNTAVVESPPAAVRDAVSYNVPPR